ncbi:hypothetical protein CPB86DRAFT_749962 [Serendipita vermifera]|nr:hypothetical protein CPB86DRAFT_749962 [Serendipita vermifera]
MDPNVVAGDSPNLDRPASNQPAGANAAAALPAAQGPDHDWHPWHSVIGLMGYGSRGTLLRKHVFTLAFKLVLGIAQITAIAVLSAISARTESPTKPGITEWEACDRPLGAWLIVWAVRVALGLAISIYSFILIRPGLLEFTYDPANGIEENAVPNNQTLPPPVGPLNGPGQPQFIHAGRVHPVPRALQSFTTILSFLSLVWFIASHILVYTSLNTCRRSSPHLWWLAFSIMSIAYLLIIEIFLVVFFLFFFAPIMLLLVNLILICLGRQPLFRPNGMNHEIGKLPQQIVDRIPLVLYIPTPPVKDGKEENLETGHTYPPTTSESVPAHSVPPLQPNNPNKEPENPVATKKRHRFFFFRRSKKNIEGDLEAGRSKANQKAPEDEWEANWERGDYPFVKLPENRATCAICLLDFEAPPRRGSHQPSIAPSPSIASGSEQTKGKTAPEGKVPVEPMTLQDAGEGATPLRLLACGHAFHQTCLDPWLKDVSGRCPVCQRKVDIEELERLSKKGSSTAWATNVLTPIEAPGSSMSNTEGRSPTTLQPPEGSTTPTTDTANPQASS